MTPKTAEKDEGPVKHLEDGMSGKNGSLRVLLIEDVPRDADLAVREIRRAGVLCEARVVATRQDMLLALTSFAPDIILSDYAMPRFTGMEALEIRNEHAPSVPFVIVTASINEETAVECIKQGADDYVTKQHLVGLPHVVQNALEKKRLEVAGQQAQERMRLAAKEWRITFDAIHDAVALLDPERRIIRCNKTLRDLIDKPWDQIIGRPCCQLVHQKAAPPTKCPVLRAAQTLRRETWRVSLDERWYSIIADPILDKQGQLTGFVHVMRDISDRLEAEEKLRESEDKYRLLVENANEIVLVVQDGMFKFANRRIFEVTGQRPGEIMEKPFIEFIHPEDREIVAQRHAQRLRGEEVPEVYPFRILSKEGEPVWVQINAVRIEWEGSPAILSFLMDITERKRAEKEQEKLREQLLQAQKMESVGRLAGGVAHDFNNMLSVILGYTEMALAELDPKDSIHAGLQEVLSAARRSTGITRQLLAFARKQAIDPKVLDLNEVIEGMLKMLRRLIGEDINISWEPDTDLWPVKMDPAQIDQVLANLCVNARDAIDGVGEIRIRTENVVMSHAYATGDAECRPGEYVVLALSDDGAGMDRETAEKIFEPFFTTKELGRGTGLGLSTVYGIVKQNEGSIHVYSEPGQGTLFKVYLPRFRGEAKAEEKGIEEPLPQGHGETVLIVEDEASVLNLVKHILKKLGYRVRTAEGAEKALKMVQECRDPIHLLISDVVMPEMGGKVLAERIKAVCPDTKLLFMSGYTADTVIHRGILDEGIPFLQKPFTSESLARKVREVLEAEDDRG